MRISDWSSDVCSSDLDDPGVNQGLLAFATEGMLIATAMRPHEGVAQSLAHRTIATSVISHTITFHEPCPPGDWFLLSLESPFAGGGRSYRSEEHTSELQSLMRLSSAVFCLKQHHSTLRQCH